KCLRSGAHVLKCTLRSGARPSAPSDSSLRPLHPATLPRTHEQHKLRARMTRKPRRDCVFRPPGHLIPSKDIAMTAYLLAGPAAEPLTLAEAKAFLRLDDEAEDALVE